MAEWNVSVVPTADRGGLRLRLRNRVDRELHMVNLAVKVLDRY
jgi:hypothetical protein